MDGMVANHADTGAEGLFDVFKKPVEGAKKDGFFGFTTGALV